MSLSANKMLPELIIPAYILTLFVPTFEAIDRNAPGFLIIAVLNLLVFVGLICHKDLKQLIQYAAGFFTQSAGYFYVSFTLFATIAIAFSGNPTESILHWAKIFTMFITAFNLTISLMHNTQIIKHLIVVMAALLLLEAGITLLQGYQVLMDHKDNILSVTLIYSNKNILAAAIFIKMAFAFWLILFEADWQKILGWVAFSAGCAAVLILGARAFYIGLFVFPVFYTIHLFWYKKSLSFLKKRMALSLITIILTVFAMSFGILVQKTDWTRLASQYLFSDEKKATASLRLDAWYWSWQIIKANPFFGVGPGNWKIAVLEHENLKNPGFVYLCKAHNDFLETMAETGIPAGLLYCGMCVAVILQYFLYRPESGSINRIQREYFFLATIGMACYCVDACFNFPSDRPEIMILFAIFVSIAIAVGYREKHGKPNQINKTVKGMTTVSLYFFCIGATSMS
jgi:O-antigen ligase